MKIVERLLGEQSGLRFYRPSEYVRRAGWSLATPLFRHSPRLLYGWRNALLRCFGARIAPGVKIYPTAKIFNPWRIEIGADTVIAWDVTLYALGDIRIGKSCVVSQGSHLCAGTHDPDQPDFPLLKLPIQVGDHCWIAADAFIGPGVELADRVIVGARSVVVKNQSPGVVVAGNPARVLRHDLPTEAVPPTAGTSP